MKNLNILSRITEEGTKLSNHAIDVAEAIAQAPYKGEKLEESFTPEEVLRMFSNICVAKEDELSDGMVANLIKRITKEVVKSELFSEVTQGATRKSIGMALVNIGTSLYGFEEVMNNVVEGMLDEGVFGDEEMDFLIANSEGIRLGKNVVVKLGKKFGVDESLLDMVNDISDNGILDEITTAEEALESFRNGNIDGEHFFVLLERGTVEIGDLIEMTTIEEFTEIMMEVKKVQEKLFTSDCSSCESCGKGCNGNLGSPKFITKKEAEIRERILNNNISDEELAHEMLSLNIDPAFVEKHYDPARLANLAKIGFDKVMMGGTGSLDEMQNTLMARLLQETSENERGISIDPESEEGKQLINIIKSIVNKK